MSYILTGLTPMLETKDMEETRNFYVDTLSFSVDNFSEEWGWMHISRDKVKLMFTRPNEHRNIPEPVMSGSLYIETDEVNEIWEQIRNKARLCYPIEDFDYGMREFAIYDNNGYLIQFGKSIQQERE